MATLIAVNVGLPKDVAWRGKRVRTGVWKHTVSGPRMARRLNIDGDGQGDLDGHGGEQRAVLVYQSESYRFWERELGRDDLRPGHFGENFTVDGLADDEVCIGDRYRIGGALFEVTQPRVTCYRVGLRLGEPQMAALLVSRRRPGFYLRVIEEGEIEAGQEIVKVSSGPEGMTVAEIDGVLYLPGRTREQVERALRIPALSPGWQGSMRALLEAGGATAERASLTPGVTSAVPARAPHQPAGAAGTGPPVSFARSGLTVPWNDDHGSLLELAEACDVPVRWSCRTGVCHTCELALMSGAVDYSPDPVEPPAEGDILICCARPSEAVVLDL